MREGEQSGSVSGHLFQKSPLPPLTKGRCEKIEPFGTDNLSCCPGDGRNLQAKIGGTFSIINGFT
jgi:hypothetical protein